MKRRSVVVSVCLLYFTSWYNQTSAQDYKAGFGLRGGITSGFSIKYFVNPHNAFEGIFSGGWLWHGVRLTGLYETHQALFTNKDIEGFYLFYGGGVHAAYFGYDVWKDPVDNRPGYFDTKYYATFGIDGILGLEYKFTDLPVTIGADIKPYIEFPTYKNAPFRFFDAALTVRYTIKHTLN